MHSFSSYDRIKTPEIVDTIEKMVSDYLKPYGFRKHGRTLHRFVDGDISQLVHFQNGCPGKGIFDVLWVNIGIRVPECAERTFEISQPMKKYYHEYECNIRTRLGHLVDGRDTYYFLGKQPELIGKSIIERLDVHVMPVFEMLNSRDAILTLRKNYPKFDIMNHRQLLLEESFIHGRRGDMETAVRCFRKYYAECCAAYQHDLETGKEVFLRKGSCMTYIDARTGRQCTVRSSEDGYVTIYNAGNAHLKYLESLAEKLNISLPKE